MVTFLIFEQVKVFAQDATQQVIKWQPAPNAASYAVQIAIDSEFKQLIREVRVNEPQVSTRDFDAGKYFLRVAAVDEFGTQGPFSNASVISILTDPIRLQSPVNKSIVDVLEPTKKITFSWSDVEGIDQFEVQISRTANFAEMKKAKVSTNELVAPLAADGKPYYWRVVGMLEDGSKSYSLTENEFTLRYFKNPPALLNPPDNKAFTTVSSRRVEVAFSWKPLPDTKTYEFELARESIEGAKVAVTAVNPTARKVGLSPGLYFWRVRATDASGRVGPWSPTRKLVVNGRVATPQIFSPKPDEIFYEREGPFEVALHWSGITEEAKYELQISKDEAFASIVKKVQTAKQSEKIKLDIGKYFARVRVTSTGLQGSGWSKVISFSTEIRRNWRRGGEVMLGYNYAFETANLKTNHVSGSLGIPETVGLGIAARYQIFDALSVKALFGYRQHVISKTYFGSTENQSDIRTSHSEWGTHINYHPLSLTPTNDFGLYILLGYEAQNRSVVVSNIDEIDSEIEQPLRSVMAKTTNLFVGGVGAQYTNSISTEIRGEFKAGFKVSEGKPKTKSYTFFEARGGFWLTPFGSFFWGVEPYASYTALKFDDVDVVGDQSSINYGLLLAIGTYWGP